MSAEAIGQVVQALQTLYTNQNASERESANAWLGEFQKSDEAWSTAQMILFAQDAPLETKLFAAQTFRTKITYDLDRLPQAQRVPLRDSLLGAIKTFASGPRVVLTQICIALADLALQMPTSEWDDPVSYMIDLFGKDPTMAAALLEFLQVVVEEYANNMRIRVLNDFGREPADQRPNGKGAQRTPKQAQQIIDLLSMYVTAQGVTSSLRNQCFVCLGAWLRAGQTPAASLTGKPILAAAFQALSDDELFDSAVDMLVDTIHETQEVEDNIDIIQDIVPRLVALQASISDPAVKDDEDKMRGLCRVFVEAGEWYVPLILQHQQTFLPIVQVIGECAAYENLEVVNITLGFWYRLAEALRRTRQDPANAVLLNVYSNLIAVIVRHLHYPEDASSLVGQELDDFKDFRHRIGDTLKDCCIILGTTYCLQKSCELIEAAMSSPAVRWQDIEAPLFSMRTMAAEVDPRDEEIMPRIMDLIPKLPAHPKIRYAATLVVGRYTTWINQHPDRIQFVLSYISDGFAEGDSAVSAAAAQALRFLCKDCSDHLVPYLSQLHTFMTTISDKLTWQDRLDISAAIAHVISVMPASDAPRALSTFCMPEVELLHKITTSSQQAGKAEIGEAKNALERLDQYLAIVGSFEQGLPAECAGVCQQVWTVFDALIVRYGGDSGLSDRACTVIRRGLQFFDSEALAVAPAVLDRMAAAFETSPNAGYLWITSKLVMYFAHLNDAAFNARIQNAFERQTSKLASMLQTTQPDQLSDVLEDYTRLVADLVEYTPHLIFPSAAFPPALQCVTTASTLLSPAIVMTALDTIRSVVGHEALMPQPGSPPEFAQYEQVIRSTIATASPQIVPMLIQTLVDGIEDASFSILTLLRLFSIEFEAQLVASVPLAVQSLGAKFASEQEKATFLAKFGEAVNEHNPNKVKESFVWLMRTSKRSLDRAHALNRQRE